MALLQAYFFSNALYRTVPIQVILPVDKFTEPNKPACEVKPFKTLYLLHGLMGNYNDWVSSTRIQRWAEQLNLAVVMPSGENSFYLDHPVVGHRLNNYSTFIGGELVTITRKMFPLSHDRKDTYIAGLSMGGSGAIRNGLKYHDTFSYIAGLSSDIYVVEDIINGGAVASDSNPPLPVLVQTIKDKIKYGKEVDFPKMFIACGTEDGFIECNRKFRDFVTENGIDITYCEEVGGHTWDFWDKYILRILEWLPLEGASES